jgi:HlyD family secretion protein
LIFNFLKTKKTPHSPFIFYKKTKKIQQNMSTTTPVRKRKSWVPFAIIGGFLALVAFAFFNLSGKPKGEEVTVAAVERRTIREKVSASGKIYPEVEIKLSSDVSGEVIELYVKEGDSVTVGQVLAKIRPDEYQSAVEQGQASVNTARVQRDISSSSIRTAEAQLEQQKADRARAAAQLEVARNAFKRSEQLHKEGVISTADFEAAQNTLRAAEAGLNVADAAIRSAETGLSNSRENVRVGDYGINSANARLKELRTSLQKTIIAAPMSGIVSRLNVERGERVLGMMQMTGTEIMRIADMRRMEVQVEVSESDVLKVAVGNEADIEVDSYLGRKFRGRVSEIARSASNVGTTTALNTDQVTNFIVKILVDPASYADLVKPGKKFPFLSGMSSAVDIFTNTAEKALSVPLVAVTTREDKSKQPAEDEKNPQAKQVNLDLSDIQEIVFVTVGDTVAIRQVKTGIQDDDFIEITSGLAEGDQVVSGPYSAVARKLESGSKVRVVTKDELRKKNAGPKKE